MIRSAFRLLVVGTLGIVLALGATLGAWLAGDLPFAGGTAIRVTKLHAAFSGVPTDGPTFVMLIGSDLRPGVGGARGDALHVLAINPKLHGATLVDIPRDTCAQVAGRGTRKINEANSVGGPAGQAAAVAALTGLPLSYAVEVDFDGFLRLVNGVGGVDVNVPFPMHDNYSNANFSPGPVHMDGTLALAFARDRHSFPRSDIQRTWNQGYLVTAAVRTLAAKYRTIAGRFELASLLVQHAQLSNVGITDIVRLGQLADAVPANAIKNVTIPYTGGSQCLGLDQRAAAKLFADVRDDGVLESYPAGTPTTPDPRP